MTYYFRTEALTVGYDGNALIEDINIGIVNLKNITINENDKIKINDDLLNFGKDQIIYYRFR